jgi:hypothetical protein
MVPREKVIPILIDHEQFQSLVSGSYAEEYRGPFIFRMTLDEITPQQMQEMINNRDEIPGR